VNIATQEMLEFPSEAAATAMFNEARTHRFRLSRTWDRKEAPLNFLMLNPSTADEKVLDPTIKGCVKRARRMGMGEVVVTNLFAIRSPYPEKLYSVDMAEAIGEGNDWHILDVARHTIAMGGMVVCGWGKHGALHGRGEHVRKMLEFEGLQLHVLELNADGSPKHPLYIAGAVLPKPWKWADGTG
jgi:hypothetical protein